MLPQNGMPRPRAGLSRPGALVRRTGLSAPRAGLAAPRASLAAPRRLNPLVRSVQPNTVVGKAAIAKREPCDTPDSDDVAHFSVLYTKRSKKKRKSWLDGYIIVKHDRHVELQNEDGKKVAAERCKPLGGLREGNTLEIASYELEVQNPVAEDDYISGRLFVKSLIQPPSALSSKSKSSLALKRTPFKPLRPKNSNASCIKRGLSTPMHDPNAANACVLLPEIRNEALGTSTIPVVLDPFLTKRMRAHQKEGIKFLYKCVQASFYLNNEGGQGAILADEMGLGKSLQAIALIWTLLKQSPSGFPLVQKAIIVCPASLTQNWGNEVQKWLGFDRLRPVQVTSGSSTFEAKEALASFMNGSVRRLLIISYEMFRSYSENLYKSNIGLMVCDEGHRLKSSQGNKTIEALRKLPCRRRVILTGTPVQNDLEEFYSVCDFVNPGCLNSLASFRAVFANPIISSRDSNASASVARLGEARAQELGRITSSFVLRRTSNILAKYLPPKQETAIFCRLQQKQEAKYEREAKNRLRDVSTSSRFCAALSAINCLRKICSHPALVGDDDYNVDSDGELDNSHSTDAVVNQEVKLEADFDDNFEVSDSSKMQVSLSLCEASLLAQDKIVLVSNYTSTLDLLQKILSRKNIKFCRLDGRTAVGHRGDIVRRFNEGSLGDVFLLSAKAGGVGLNLIGANRLILFDPDWNPATDLQAMARVWRDGQKKRVFVYRLLCTGTIEEKIFQRQLFKGELQSAVDGEHVSDGQRAQRASGSKEGNFSAEELRDLFQYDPNHTYCDTLEVLERSQEESTLADEGEVPRPAALLNEFRAYKNLFEAEKGIRGEVFCGEDKVLHQTLNCTVQTHDLVSYLYTKKSLVAEEAEKGTERVTGCNEKPVAGGDASKNPGPRIGKRARDPKSIFANDSDSPDDSSEEDEEIKVLMAMRCSAPSSPTRKCVDDKTETNVAPECLNHETLRTEPRRKSWRGTAGGTCNTDTSGPLSSTPAAGDVTTWDDALKDLETDVF